jgi:predicted porin
MKKSLLALAVLGAFAGTASAQSSVTVFGVLDVGYNYLDNDGGSFQGTTVAGGKMHRLANDQYASSRLGFRGVEDLGGGLKAGFWLESALSPDNGSADSTRFFGRRATASLLGGFGEIRLGRDFTPTYTSWADYAVFGTNGSAGSNIFNNTTLSSAANAAFGTTAALAASPTGAGTVTRADNEVSYFLPALGGLIGQFSVAAGEGATTPNKYYGGRIGYAAGPVSVQIGYGETETTPSAVVADDKFTRWTVGGSYDAGVVKALAYYVQSEWGPRESKTYEVGVSVPVGAGLIRAAYAHIDIEGGNSFFNGEADKFAVGYVHNLSKRTALYATYALIDNDGAAAYSVGGNGNSATISGGTTVPGVINGGKSQGVDIGVRHNF